MQNAKVRSLTLCALFAALLAVCSQIQIPLPMVPINLALFAAHLAGAVLGAKYGALSVTVYAALGLVGVPVFAGFGAGPATLFGRTGGYVLGYILAAAIAGLWRERHGFAPLRLALGLALGTLGCYALGTAWFMAVAHQGLGAALAYCVLPFLPGDAVKIALACTLSGRLYAACNR